MLEALFGWKHHSALLFLEEEENLKKRKTFEEKRMRLSLLNLFNLFALLYLFLLIVVIPFLVMFWLVFLGLRCHQYLFI